MKAKKIIATLLMLPMLMVGCTKAGEKQSEEIGGTIKVVTSRTDADKLFEKIDLKPNIICEVEEDNAVAGLVEINYGIAVVPRISSLKNYNIKILPIIKPTHERFIYLATLKNRYLTPSANLFKNFITENSKDKFSDIKK